MTPIGTTALTRASPTAARMPVGPIVVRIGSVQGRGRVQRGSSRARPGRTGKPTGGAGRPVGVTVIAERQTVAPGP